MRRAYSRPVAPTPSSGSDPLEVPLELPGGDDLVLRLELEPRRVEAVLVHRVAERLAREAALLQLGDRLAERAGDLRERRVLVRVAAVERRRLELPLDAVETRRDRRREGEVRVRVRARDAVLDPERIAAPADAEARRP